jgi:hypothetical protein
MELWLSWSLSRIFLSHIGILAITEPFSNFSFTRWNFGYHGVFHELLRSFSHGGIHETHDLGEILFIYIRKSIYIGPALLKTLPHDLESPLQGKEYGPSYSKVIAKKVNVFVPETTYRLVIRIFAFLQNVNL